MTILIIAVFNIQAENLDLNNLASVKSLKLNPESQNTIYFIDYNQDNSKINNFINSDLKNIKKSEFRFIPINSGNKSLCFNIKNGIYKLAKYKCESFDSYSFESDNNLPIIILPDSTIVNNANKVKAQEINQYINILIDEKNQAKLDQENKIKQQKIIDEQNEQQRIKKINVITDNNIKKYQNKYSQTLWLFNSINFNIYQSYFSFYNKNITKIVVNKLNKKTERFHIESNIESQHVNSINQHILKDSIESNLSKNTTFILNMPEASMSINNNNFNLFKQKYSKDNQKNDEINKNNLKQNNKDNKDNKMNKVNIHNYKVIKTEQVNNDITIKYNSQPNITKVNIKWGKFSKPTPYINTAGIGTQDNDISIKDNLK